VLARIEDGHLDVARLAHGVDVNLAREEDGCTPLEIVCIRGIIEVVEMLLSCDGIAVNKEGQVSRVTVLPGFTWRQTTAKLL
jgi:hypothetical protein